MLMLSSWGLTGLVDMPAKGLLEPTLLVFEDRYLALLSVESC